MSVPHPARSQALSESELGSLLSSAEALARAQGVIWSCWDFLGGRVTPEETALILELDPLLEDRWDRCQRAVVSGTSSGHAHAPPQRVREELLVELDVPGARCPAQGLPACPRPGSYLTWQLCQQRDLEGALEATQKENLSLKSRSEASSGGPGDWEGHRRV